MPLDNNAISIKNAYKYFDKTIVLNGLDFHLKNGEILALLGANGAGKSTLIKSICGLHSFDKAEFEIFGKNVSLKNYNLKTARDLGIECVFQEQNLGLKQEIYRNIFATRHITNKFGFIDIQREIDVSNDLLRDFMGFKSELINATSITENLSGGEKQGLSIIRAIYFKSKILILDEPTSALGVNETKKFLDYLKSLENTQISVILITHNISHAYEICDRFNILSHGKIIQDKEKFELQNLQELYELFKEA